MIIFLFLILAILGIADSSYLLYEHFSNDSIVCVVTSGCDVVLTSKYSEILGIPTALFGVLYYLYIFILSIYYLFRKPTKLLGYSTMIGLFASIFFLYIQAFILESYCFYCLISAIISILLFVLSLFLLKYKSID